MRCSFVHKINLDFFPNKLELTHYVFLNIILMFNLLKWVAIAYIYIYSYK